MPMQGAGYMAERKKRFLPCSRECVSGGDRHGSGLRNQIAMLRRGMTYMAEEEKGLLPCQRRKQATWQRVKRDFCHARVSAYQVEIGMAEA